jgi:2-hydroxychromene-2-carboxylate isomerase
MTQRTSVEFWFDPGCPWAWMTSRWVVEAAEVRPLDVHWRLMSLALLNEGKEESDVAREGHWKGHLQLRVIAAARDVHGEQVVLPLYTAFGTRFHLSKESRGPEATVAALGDAGLDVGLVDAMDDARWDAAIRTDHDAALDRVGDGVGTPAIAVGDTAFFGPVVTPAPEGDAAGLLWDGVLLVAGTPGFYELKRTRDLGPIFS